MLVHSLAFILGFSVVFVSLGASFSAAGQFLLDYREWIRIAGGGLIIVFGLYIAGVLRIGIFGRTQQLQIQSKPAGLLGSFLVGLTFAIGWTPCVGPILGSILTLASNDKTVGQVFATHASVMSDPANKGERISLFNPAQPTAKVDTLVGCEQVRSQPLR